MPNQHQPVARVVGIYRFLVKSMAAERLDQVKIGWHGLEGDRRFAFFDKHDKSGLPWLSARECPQLILYKPVLVDAANGGASAIQVRTPSGQSLLLEDHELREQVQQLSNRELGLMQLWRGAFDSMAISLISQNSIRAVSSQLACDLEVERFRANLIIDVFGDHLFPEDRWLGELLVLGDRDNSARLRVNRKDPRCTIVNLAPGLAESNPAILAEIGRTRKNCLGVYATTERPGSVELGDVLYIVKR